MGAARKEKVEKKIKFQYFRKFLLTTQFSMHLPT